MTYNERGSKIPFLLKLNVFYNSFKSETFVEFLVLKTKQLNLDASPCHNDADQSGMLSGGIVPPSVLHITSSFNIYLSQQIAAAC